MSHSERVETVVAEVLGLPAEQVTDATTMDAIEAWDSIKHIELMSTLEDRFGVTLATDDMIAMVDVPAIRRALQNLGATVE
jgi:acyl carrier protein